MRSLICSVTLRRDGMIVGFCLVVTFFAADVSITVGSSSLLLPELLSELLSDSSDSSEELLYLLCDR